MGHTVSHPKIHRRISYILTKPKERLNVSAFPYPFPGTIEELMAIQETIPIDPDVPFAEGYRKLYEESGGAPWGPQASDRSILAVRLWFAGWPRKGLIELGLEPKHVENFRSNKGLTTGVPGRKHVRKKTRFAEAMGPAGAVIDVVTSALKELSDKRAFVNADIDRLERELEVRKGERALLDRMLEAADPGKPKA